MENQENKAVQNANKNNQKVKYMGLGRRKSSSARVTLISKGTGKITVNNRSAEEYFPNETLIQEIKQGFFVTETENQFDVIANIKGGGFSGQAGALRHGIVKALLLVSDDFRTPLKQAGLITRDSRVKERKKYGLKGARRSPQFSKR